MRLPFESPKDKLIEHKEDILLYPIDKITNFVPNALEIITTVVKMGRAFSPSAREIIAAQGSPTAYAMGLVTQTAAIGYVVEHYSESIPLTISSMIGSLVIPSIIKKYRRKRDQTIEGEMAEMFFRKSPF